MAVRIRLKKLGRKHRPYYRICVMDQRTPRGGRAIEEVGTYDPMVPETDARVTLNGERVDYWLSVGAQPSDKVKVLIKKYGTNGTHLEQQKAATERLSQTRASKAVPPPPFKPKPLKAVPQPAAESTDDAETPAAEEPVATEEATAES